MKLDIVWINVAVVDKDAMSELPPAVINGHAEGVQNSQNGEDIDSSTSSDKSPVTSQPAYRPDVIRISGKAEQCEAAKNAMMVSLVASLFLVS